MKDYDIKIELVDNRTLTTILKLGPAESREFNAVLENVVNYHKTIEKGNSVRFRNDSKKVIIEQFKQIISSYLEDKNILYSTLQFSWINDVIKINGEEIELIPNLIDEFPFRGSCFYTPFLEFKVNEELIDKSIMPVVGIIKIINPELKHKLLLDLISSIYSKTSDGIKEPLLDIDEYQYIHVASIEKIPEVFEKLKELSQLFNKNVRELQDILTIRQESEREDIVGNTLEEEYRKKVKKYFGIDLR